MAKKIVTNTWCFTGELANLAYADRKKLVENSRKIVFSSNYKTAFGTVDHEGRSVKWMICNNWNEQTSDYMTFMAYEDDLNCIEVK